MLARLLAHLRAQWIGVLALLIALGTGTTYAANTVFSTDIVNGEVFSADVRNDSLTGGGLVAADLRTNAVGASEIATGGVRSAEVDNQTLTGADIADRSGVDTCPTGSQRFGELCVRVANLALQWTVARRFCADLELHLPTVTEAATLARNHDIPNVDSGEFFWTDEFWVSDTSLAGIVFANGEFAADEIDSDAPETVCVTTPTN